MASDGHTIAEWKREAKGDWDSSRPIRPRLDQGISPPERFGPLFSLPGRSESVNIISIALAKGDAWNGDCAACLSPLLRSAVLIRMISLNEHHDGTCDSVQCVRASVPSSFPPNLPIGAKAFSPLDRSVSPASVRPWKSLFPPFATIEPLIEVDADRRLGAYRRQR
jgi:hypothetical protein